MRALHEAELRNELEIFGQPLDGAVFPPATSRLFDTEPEASATLPFVQGHAELVSGLAKRVTADSATLARLLGCEVDRIDTETCKDKLFDFVIARLFRGRQDDETAGELRQAFDAGFALGGDFRSGARALLEVALQSPEFLYRLELGRPVEGRTAEWSQPTDVEMASRLSFLFWDRGPDDELLAAAARGALSDPADIEAQARRLLADDRAKSAVRRFYRELMSSEQEPKLDVAVPEFTPAVVELMDQEFAGFVDRATFSGAGDFRALFAPNTSVNGPLASYYGLPGIEGEAFRPVELEASKFAGILTQPAWLTRASLAGFTDPSLRGWVISRALLCSEIPGEPKGVMDHPPAPVPDKTTRERAGDPHHGAGVRGLSSTDRSARLCPRAHRRGRALPRDRKRTDYRHVGGDCRRRGHVRRRRAARRAVGREPGRPRLFRDAMAEVRVWSRRRRGQRVLALGAA